MKSAIALFLSMFILSMGGIAQTLDSVPGRSIFSLGLRGHGGYFIKHSPLLNDLKESYPWGFEADMAWRLTEDNAYQHCNCFPRVGVSINYFNYNNPAVLGSSYSVSGYVEPMFFLPRRFSFSLRIGLVGIAFMDRPYDKESNPDNLAYGVHYAFPLVLGFSFNYHVNPRWNIRLGGNFNHMSNGGINHPNLGLNFATAHLGIDYSFEPIHLANQGKMGRPKPEKKNRLEVDIGNSMKNVDKGSSKHFWILNTNVQYSRWFYRSSAITVGANFEMDNSRKEHILRSEDPLRSHLRLSFSLGHEFWLGKLLIGQHVGVYVFDQFRVNLPVYHRHEVTYQILPYLYVSIGAKIHLAAADYTDIKIGYNFNWK